MGGKRREVIRKRARGFARERRDNRPRRDAGGDLRPGFVPKGQQKPRVLTLEHAHKTARPERAVDFRYAITYNYCVICNAAIPCPRLVHIIFSTGNRIAFLASCALSGRLAWGAHSPGL